MKFIREILTNISLVVVFVSLAGIGGIHGGYYAARTTLNTAAGEPARAKATFTGPNEIHIEVPGVVIRGRRITCFIFADTKRRISSVNC